MAALAVHQHALASFAGVAATHLFHRKHRLIAEGRLRLGYHAGRYLIYRPRRRRARVDGAAQPMSTADTRSPRADVRCRNCGGDAPGAYCPACGQETRIALPRVGEFVREAAGRLVAWDGRLWRTLATLAFRPGVLTREYFAGRRRRYVGPARLFLALSLLLFALLSVLRSPTLIGDELLIGTEAEIAALRAERARQPDAKPPADGAGAPAERGGQVAAAGESPGEALISIEVDDANRIRLDREMNLKIRLDGIEPKLPAEIQKRYQRFKAMSQQDRLDHVYAGVMRYGPYMAVLMLPLFALLLKLAYLGSARRYPGRPQRYAEHLVYSAHMHAFAALVLLMWLVPQPSWTRVASLGWIVYYLFRACDVVYGGRRWAAALRALVVALVYAIVAVLALAGLVVAATMLR